MLSSQSRKVRKNEMVELQEIWMRFRGVILSMRWNDVLDIALVSFLIYKVIQLIRSTRAAQLFKGVIIILLIYGFVRLTKLEMMQMLFDSVVLQVGIFSVIVIFQQEIRRAIEQIGKSSISSFRFFGLTADSEEYMLRTQETIGAVTDACQTLRNLKMGALMVFENKDSLEDVIRSGTIVDGRPSPELIGNIFFNKAPLHDGAMIIRSNKVYAAGCILPLTQNTEISSELGTRHRAAIGLSECSDAIVVVVSEETGNISIARNGSLTRNYTKDTLRAALEGMLITTEETAERRRFPKTARKKEMHHE